MEQPAPEPSPEPAAADAPPVEKAVFPLGTDRLPQGQGLPHSLKVQDILRNPKSPTRFDGCYRFSDLPSEGDILCQWRFKPEIAGFSIQGQVDGTLILDCVRCLSPCHLPVHLEINERYVLESYMDPLEKEKELQAEDYYEVIADEARLDLGDLAHQFLLLEADSQPLCGRPDCDFVTKSGPPETFPF